MSRRKFLDDMRLDTRNSGAGSRRESVVASPFDTERKAASPIAAEEHAPLSTRDTSERALFAEPSERVAEASEADRQEMDNPSSRPATLARPSAAEEDSAMRASSAEATSTDVPSPTSAFGGEEELNPLFLARVRSNTIPFNYRPAGPPTAVPASHTPPKSDAESTATPDVSSPPGPPVAAHTLGESPYSSPRTARPGGSRVPAGPVVVMPALEEDEPGLPVSATDTPRVGGAQGAYGQYMSRRSVDPASPEAAPREPSPPTTTPTTNASTAATSTTSPPAHGAPAPPHELDVAEYRARSGSITRVENTLFALQVELAREKKHNIDAEQRVHALAREVETLRAENMRLAAALGSAARRGSDSTDRAETGPGASGSSGHTQDLERAVQQLSTTLAAKDAALAARDERIRLLEHRLVDRVLAGGVVTPGGSPSQGFIRSTSPATSLSHTHEVRAAELRPYDSRVDAPPMVVTSTKLDHTGTDREVGSALRRRATDMGWPDRGGHGGAPSDSPVPHNLSPGRRRANSAVVAARADTSHMGSSSSSSAAPRRGSVAQRKGSTARGLDRRPSLTESTHSGRHKAGSGAPRIAPTSAKTQRKTSVISSVNSSVNDGNAPASGRQRRASAAAAAAGPRASPLRRDSATRRRSSVSSLSEPAAPDASSARRRSSVSGITPTSAPRRASGAHPVQLQRTPKVGTTAAPEPPGSAPRRSMMASYATPYRSAVSPTRSIAPSMHSTTSTRSRPQISFNAKDDVTTMKGTTTTVVFRSRSPTTMDFTPSRSPYAAALTPEREAQPFVSEHFSETTYHPNRLVRTPQEAPLE